MAIFYKGNLVSGGSGGGGSGISIEDAYAADISAISDLSSTVNGDIKTKIDASKVELSSGLETMVGEKLAANNDVNNSILSGAITDKVASDLTANNSALTSMISTIGMGMPLIGKGNILTGNGDFETTLTCNSLVITEFVEPSSLEYDIIKLFVNDVLVYSNW